MAEHEPDRQADRSDLDRRAPAPLLRLVICEDGPSQLEGATALPLALLGRPLHELQHRQFADGLFEDGAAVLDAAVAASTGEAGEPFVLRWGQKPPVTTLGV